MSARSIATAGDDSTRSDREIARELFARFTELPEDDPKRQRVRDQLVEMHLPLVEYLARRFAGRGEPLDDLIQVGTIGLIKAVDRFDTERGVLAPNDPPSVALPPGDGPRHFHFHPSGRWFYSIQEEGSTLVLFDYEAASGRLSSRSTTPRLLWAPA